MGIENCTAVYRVFQRQKRTSDKMLGAPELDRVLPGYLWDISQAEDRGVI
jgi:hypothetical protein